MPAAPPAWHRGTGPALSVDTDGVDILAAIDAALCCQHCGGPFGVSPSADFCSDDCQQAWHAARSDELVGYREPDDQSWAEDPPWSSEFRLPRSTGNLRADWRAARRAEATATTDAQRGAVRLRIRSLNDRERAAAAEAMDAMWPAMEAAMVRYRGLTERVAAVRGGGTRPGTGELLGQSGSGSSDGRTVKGVSQSQYPPLPSSS